MCDKNVKKHHKQYTLWQLEDAHGRANPYGPPELGLVNGLDFFAADRRDANLVRYDRAEVITYRMEVTNNSKSTNKAEN